MSSKVRHVSDDDNVDTIEEPLSWKEWIFLHRKKIIIGGIVTSLCVGCGYYIWKSRNKRNSEYGTYHDKSSGKYLRIDDQIQGKDMQFTNGWFAVSSDVQANKCGDRVYFNGMISNGSTQMDHESLPPGTMFEMPNGWRPLDRAIYDLKDNKSNYNLYLEFDLADKTDKIEILPNGEVNLIGGSIGWFINLTGCWYPLL